MGELIVFPLVLREPPTRKRRKKAEVAVFPHSRRLHHVENHARALRKMSAAEREDYLTEVLDRVCAELAALGIDCCDCQNDAIVDLAEAVGQQLHGPQFRLELERAAR
jgi:hypothetical protein